MKKIALGSIALLGIMSLGTIVLPVQAQTVEPDPWVTAPHPSWEALCKGNADILERRRNSQGVNNAFETYTNSPFATTFIGPSSGRQATELNIRNEQAIKRLEANQRECQRLTVNKLNQRLQNQQTDEDLRSPNSTNRGFGSGF